MFSFLIELVSRIQISSRSFRCCTLYCGYWPGYSIKRKKTLHSLNIVVRQRTLNECCNCMFAASSSVHLSIHPFVCPSIRFYLNFIFMHVLQLVCKCVFVCVNLFNRISYFISKFLFYFFLYLYVLSLSFVLYQKNPFLLIRLFLYFLFPCCCIFFVSSFFFRYGYSSFRG